MSDMPDDLIDLKAAARLARCHLATAYRWALSGRLRAWKRVGRLFVSRADVLALYERREVVRPERGPTRAQTSARTQRVLAEFGL